MGFLRWLFGSDDKKLPAVEVAPPSQLWTPPGAATASIDTRDAVFLNGAVMPLYNTRVREIADSPQTPWICAEWAEDDRTRCLECNKEIALPQHHHCCGGHIHVTSGGSCYFKHIRTHLKLDFPVQPLSELLAHRLLLPATTPGPIYQVLRRSWCQHCHYIGPSLTVDHWDGDHSNNDPDNLVTLCANCHMMKTRAKGENRPLRLRPRNADFMPIG